MLKIFMQSTMVSHIKYESYHMTHMILAPLRRKKKRWKNAKKEKKIVSKNTQIKLNNALTINAKLNKF